jgi:hypothetical protein
MYGNSVINRCEARFQSLLPAISEANEQRELNLKPALLRELPIWEVSGSAPLKPALNLIVSQQAVQRGETKAVSHSKVKACSSGQVASLSLRLTVQARAGIYPGTPLGLSLTHNRFLIKFLATWNSHLCHAICSSPSKQSNQSSDLLLPRNQPLVTPLLWQTHRGLILDACAVRQTVLSVNWGNPGSSSCALWERTCTVNRGLVHYGKEHAQWTEVYRFT